MGGQITQDDIVKEKSEAWNNKYSRVNIHMKRSTKERLKAFCIKYDIHMSKLVNILIYKFFYDCDLSDVDLDSLKDNYKFF